jgi:hypothetical protein
VSLKPRKLFKALDGSRLPEFARCQDLTLAVMILLAARDDY